MQYVTRILEKSIRRQLADSREPHNVLLLYGARQTGKSTLLKTILPPEKNLHINLAKEAGLARAIDTTNSFEDFTFLLKARLQFEPGKKSAEVLIIDEAQLAKKLGSYVRFMKEEWRTQKVILTGSTLMQLFENSEKPTGRIVEYVLRPFTFTEFLDGVGKNGVARELDTWTREKPFSNSVHFEILQHLQDYFTVGGLPEAVSAFSQKKDPIKVLSDIFAFYQRDFDEIIDNRWQYIYSQAMLRIAVTEGSNIGLSAIIKSSEPGYKKLPAVLNLLESWHHILKVDVDTLDLNKTGMITPKRYLFDLGIRYLQNPIRFSDISLHDPQAVKRTDYGGLVESFVAGEIFALGLPVLPKAFSLTHQSGHIDFVTLINKIPYAFEVKSALKSDRKHLSALVQWKNLYPKGRAVLTNLSPGGIIHLGKTEFTVVPVYALRTWIEKTAL